MLLEKPHLSSISYEEVSFKEIASYFLYKSIQLLDRQNSSLLGKEENINKLATNIGIILHNFKMEKEEFVVITTKFLKQYKKINGKYKYFGYITPNMMGNMELVGEILSSIDYEDYEKPRLDLKDREKRKNF
jgi:hypothetical protein